MFPFHDALGRKRLGTRRLTNVLTVRAGEIVYDRDGLAFPDWDAAAGSAERAR